jgi:septal ring factor EnvC (AmiA/AmiB activator)
LITENTTLKHRIRELTQEVKRFQERLQAARDNNRFLDNKIADLEAQLVNPTNVLEPSPRSPATADRYSATTAAASTPSRSSNWPPRAPATQLFST